MIRILGVHGISGSGKDTFADYAAKYFDANRISSGDVLKAEVKNFFTQFGVSHTDANLYGTQDEKLAILQMPREILDLIGFERYEADSNTAFFRCRDLMSWWCDRLRELEGEDYFIAKALKNVKAGLNIITDVRFPNEAKYIHRKGGLLVKVTRPGVESDDPIDHALDHWKAWDFTYENSGSLQTYHEWIGRVCNFYLGLMRE